MNEKTNEFAAKMVNEIVSHSINEQNAIFAELREMLIKYRQNVIGEMGTEIETRNKEKSFACESMDEILISAYNPPPEKGIAR